MQPLYSQVAVALSSLQDDILLDLNYLNIAHQQGGRAGYGPPLHQRVQGNALWIRQRLAECRTMVDHAWLTHQRQADPITRRHMESVLADLEVMDHKLQEVQAQAQDAALSPPEAAALYTQNLNPGLHMLEQHLNVAERVAHPSSRQGGCTTSAFTGSGHKFLQLRAALAGWYYRLQWSGLGMLLLLLGCLFLVGLLVGLLRS